VGKSHVRLISSQQKLLDSDICAEISGRQLSRVQSLEYLGTYVDENLTWQRHTHANMFIKGCSLDYTVSIVCVPYLIGCWADYCITLLFTSILDYCDVAWSPSSGQFFFEDLKVFILNFVHWFLPLSEQCVASLC